MGWFQSSFLVGNLVSDKTPFRALLTHGFVLDPNGIKMSKSQGNVIDPLVVVNHHGADVLRLWVATTDYTNDVRVGNQTITAVGEVYKKLRNTLRYLLGALDGYETNEGDLSGAGTLDGYVLYRLAEVMETCEKAAREYNFTRYTTALHEFCVHTLSTLYFDVRKDTLYCDRLDDPKRRACLYVLSRVFDAIVPLLAPVISFTAEEAWRTRYPEAVSVHLERWPQRLEVSMGHNFVQSAMDEAETIRVMIEEARKEGTIKGAGEVVLRGQTNKGSFPVMVPLLKELLLVSDIIPETTPLRVENAVQAGYVKCDRCRLYYEKLAGEFCERCEDAMEDFRDAG